MLQCWRACRKIEKENQIECEWRGKDRVAAEEVNLDLHWISQPAKDVDVIPALFVVAPWRIVVNADFVIQIPVQIRIELGLKDEVEHAELRFFLRLERFGIVEHFAVAIAEDVGGVPSGTHRAYGS